MSLSRSGLALLACMAGCGGETSAPQMSPGAPQQPSMATPARPSLEAVGSPRTTERASAPEQEKRAPATAPLSTASPVVLPPGSPSAAPHEPPARKVFTPPPFHPSPEPPTATTPAFTFRTMDHQLAYVIVNGERYSDTTCQWALSLSTPFDPAIKVAQWPPPGAAWVGALSGTSDDTGKTSKVEIAIEGGFNDLAGKNRLKRDYPNLEPGEQILYVTATIEGRERRGALRLKLVATDGTFYRYTNYSPLQNMEEENASRFARAVWFQREEEE
jgi:hypothetical protein